MKKNALRISYTLLICFTHSTKLVGYSEEKEKASLPYNSETLYNIASNNETEEFCNEPIDLTVQSKRNIPYFLCDSKRQNRKTVNTSAKLSTAAIHEHHRHSSNEKYNINFTYKYKCVGKLKTPPIRNRVFSGVQTKTCIEKYSAGVLLQDDVCNLFIKVNRDNALPEQCSLECNDKSKNSYVNAQRLCTDDLQPTTNIPIFNSICNRNSSSISTNINQNYFELESIANRENGRFFHSTIMLLKNILYYRYNIAKFFNVFDMQSNNEDKSEVNRSAKLLKFIDLSIRFGKTGNKPKRNNEYNINEDQYNEIKIYETWLKNELKSSTEFFRLGSSSAYNAIKKYNAKYCIKLTSKIRSSDFDALYIFLHNCVLYKKPISKYYPMLTSLLISLYDISLIINEKINFTKQQYLLECKVFEVFMCKCSKEIKNYFVFHWVYCWISCFSKYFILPTYSKKKDDCWYVLTLYPKEFFIQLVLLVHIVINFENSNDGYKDLEKSFLVDLKNIISELLFVHVDHNMKTIYQTTLETMFICIRNIFNYKICYRNSIQEIRVIQTMQENTNLSNNLIPMLQYVINKIIYLAKESYRRALIQRS